jgi:hypothetical protein
MEPAPIGARPLPSADSAFAAPRTSAGTTTGAGVFALDAIAAVAIDGGPACARCC